MRRTLLRMRLPLAVFILAILVLSVASFAVFNSVFAAHVEGDHFKLETRYVDIDFPRNWYAFPWEDKNISGTKYGILLAPTELRASMFILVYDKDATKAYVEQNGILDASSLVVFELERLFNWTLEKSENATLHFLKNGTVDVSGYTLTYSTVMMEKGYVDDQGKNYNWTWTFMSYVSDKILQITYHGVEEDYGKALNSFQVILNSTKVK